MAMPKISICVNTGSDKSPTWRKIEKGEVITFAGKNSSKDNIRPVPRPDGVNKTHISDELWLHGKSIEKSKVYEAGGDESPEYNKSIFRTHLLNTNYFAIQADVNPESQAGELEAWDDIHYASAKKEILSGTKGLGGHSQIRAVETASNVKPSAGVGNLPDEYKVQTAQTTKFQIQGATRKIVFSQPLNAGMQNRIALHVLTVADSKAGQDMVELTYKHYYT